MILKIYKMRFMELCSQYLGLVVTF